MKRIVLFLFVLIFLFGCEKAEIIDLSDYEIESMIENLEIVSYTADYDMKMSAVSPKIHTAVYFDYRLENVRFKMVTQISSKIRNDFILKGKLGEGVIREIDEVKTCNYPPGVCLDVTDFGKDLVEPEYLMLNSIELIRKADKTYLGTEEILGVKANCFNLINQINNETHEQDICYHPEYSIILKSVSGSSKMTAVNLEIGEVPDSEFEGGDNDVDISNLAESIKKFVS